MSDDTANIARLMRVTDAVIEELNRQGVAEVMANLGFDPTRMAQAVIRAADGDVIPFPAVFEAVKVRFPSLRLREPIVLHTGAFLGKRQKPWAWFLQSAIPAPFPCECGTHFAEDQ
jgi:hypothetical protein